MDGFPFVVTTAAERIYPFRKAVLPEGINTFPAICNSATNRNWKR